MLATVMLPRRDYVYVSNLCPLGNSYYSCESSKFRGCCATDPCTLLNYPRDKILHQDPDDVAVESSTDLETSIASTEKTSKTKTDSGVTHTIPNNSIVTVTKHTIVFSEAPSSTPISSGIESGNGDNSSNASPTMSDLPPIQTDSHRITDNKHGVSSSAIVGAAIGGISIMAIVVVLVFWWKRKVKHQDLSSTSHDDSHDIGRSQAVDVDEKYFPTHVSPQTTGTKANSDPFAPFGGKDWPPISAAIANMTS